MPRGRRKRPLRKERLNTVKRIRIARRLTGERLKELLREHGTIEVELDDLAAAPNPASTKYDLYGPATITYVQHEAGIDTFYREASGVEARFDS